MSARLWTLFEFVSALLEPNERQQVLGDIQERGANARALLDLTGLVLLRQLQAWLDWRPWALTVALVLPITFAGKSANPLALIALSGHLISFEEGSGGGNFIIRPWALLTTLILAWAVGFTLGRLGQRRSASVLLILIALSGFIAYSTTSHVFQIQPAPTWKTFFEIYPSASHQIANTIRSLSEPLRFAVAFTVMLVLVTLPALHGWYRAQKLHPLSLGLAVAITAVVFWAESAWLPQHFVYSWEFLTSWRFLAALWPVAYILMISYRSRAGSQRSRYN